MRREAIAKKPEVVKGFVQATLKGLKDVMSDPTGSAKLVAENVPQLKGQEAFLEDVMKRYGELVYATEPAGDLGKFDKSRVEAVQKFYLENGIISKATPVDELFTNEFVN